MATTLDDLLALLPDNASGQISAADMRQIVTVLWGKGSLGGQLESDGTVAYLPAGWSARRVGTGVYEVTHGLGTLNYAVSVTPLVHDTTDAIVPSVRATDENTFTYQTFHTGRSALHDVWTQFVVAVNP
jgi:hypothetical protein